MYLLRGSRFEEFYIHDLTRNTLLYDHSVADRKICKLVCTVFSLIQFLKYDTTKHPCNQVHELLTFSVTSNNVRC